MLWRALCNQFGINVRAVCQITTVAETVGTEGRKKHCLKVARFIDSSIGLRDSLHGHLSTGWGIVVLYLLVKFLYFFNAVAQFFVLQHFLGAKTNWWGVQVLGDLINGR